MTSVALFCVLLSSWQLVPTLVEQSTRSRPIPSYSGSQCDAHGLTLGSASLVYRRGRDGPYRHLNQFSDRRNLLDALTAVNPTPIATRIDYLTASPAIGTLLSTDAAAFERDHQHSIEI